MSENTEFYLTLLVIIISVVFVVSALTDVQSQESRYGIEFTTSATVE